MSKLKDKIFSMRMSQDEFLRVKSKADQDGMSVGAWIREILRKEIESNEKKSC